MVPAELEYDLW